MSERTVSRRQTAYDCGRAEINAQSNWSEYLKYDISTSNEIHIETAGIGSEMSILNSYKVLSKVRDRALEMIEYCILFEGNYEFVFK